MKILILFCCLIYTALPGLTITPNPSGAARIAVASTNTSSNPPETSGVTVQLVTVLDGDTLVVRGQGQPFKVRLYGVDCPEKRQAFGQEATAITQTILENQRITLRVQDIDKYGRTVATVQLDSGRTLQEHLLESGAAWLYTPFWKNPLSCLHWQWLEWKARWNKTGLWGQGNPVAPWKWRRGVQ